MKVLNRDVIGFKLISNDEDKKSQVDVCRKCMREGELRAHTTENIIMKAELNLEYVIYCDRCLKLLQ